MAITQSRRRFVKNAAIAGAASFGALVQFAGVPIVHPPDGLKALRWLGC
jgi:hypothetical protein